MPGGRQKCSLRSTPKLLEIGLAIASRTWHLAGIQIEIAGLMHLPRRDIANLRGQILCELLLDREVPALDVAALEAVAGGRKRVLRRDIDDAVAERRRRDLRYSFTQRAVRGRVGIRCVAVQN